uniref:Uncharacterized protein n=1 Tax=Kalanchoe fedtschenkoi TaxID=63787 RepID=A0A7N0UX65_KALFE
METSTNEVEWIQQAVYRLTEENNMEGLSVDQILTAGEDDGQIILSKLLLQLETLQANNTSEDILGVVLLETQGSPAPDGPDKVDSRSEVNDESTSISTGTELTNKVADEIIKELEKLRKQNVMTYCLLSAMMVLTLVWQLSEMSLVLKVKNGLSNPFKVLGGVLFRMIVKPANGQGSAKKPNESHSLPRLHNLNLSNYNGHLARSSD